jgi:hypothetical protein
VADPRDLGQQIDDWLGRLDPNDPGQAELERLLLRAERDIRNRTRLQEELQHALNDTIASCRLKVRQLSPLPGCDHLPGQQPWQRPHLQPPARDPAFGL